MTLWIVTILLIVTIVLLMTEKLPVDLTAIGIMVALVLAGILTPLEAVSGFASPAVITVGSDVHDQPGHDPDRSGGIYWTESQCHCHVEMRVWPCW